jgi:hypothetical protein
MEQKKQVDVLLKRKNMSFFLMMFPSALLSLIPGSFNGNIFYPIILKVLILFYQYFIVKNFVESAYD